MVARTVSGLPRIFLGQRMASFVTACALSSGNWTLVIAGNPSIDTMTDGVPILGATFGWPRTALTSSAIDGGATRAQIRP